MPRQRKKQADEMKAQYQNELGGVDDEKKSKSSMKPERTLRQNIIRL
ncbi:MAG: hypothetical protein L6V88_09590 [Anaerotruncus sp.]|nr:MAG: hypothetical protein L6V88_09590 [Anaerotruncus sp.]